MTPSRRAMLTAPPPVRQRTSLRTASDAFRKCEAAVIQTQKINIFVGSTMCSAILCALISSLYLVLSSSLASLVLDGATLQDAHRCQERLFLPIFLAYTWRELSFRDYQKCIPANGASISTSFINPLAPPSRPFHNAILLLFSHSSLKYHNGI